MKTSEALDFLTRTLDSAGDVELLMIGQSGKIMPVKLTFCTISEYNNTAAPVGIVRVDPVEQA